MTSLQDNITAIYEGCLLAISPILPVSTVPLFCPGSDPHHLLLTSPHQPHFWSFCLLNPHLLHLPCCRHGNCSTEHFWPCLSHAVATGDSLRFLVWCMRPFVISPPYNSPGTSTSLPGPKTSLVLTNCIMLIPQTFHCFLMPPSLWNVLFPLVHPANSCSAFLGYLCEVAFSPLPILCPKMCIVTQEVYLI